MIRRFLYFISVFCLLCLYFSPPLCAVVDEADPPARQIRYVPHEFIVKYKEGQNPNDLAQEVAKRAERGRTFSGLLRNVGGDLVTRFKRQETPEEAAEALRSLEAKVKVVDKEHVFTSWAEKKVLGATSEEEAFPVDDYFLLKTSSQFDTRTAVEEFRKDPRVSFASLNYLFKLLETPNDPYWNQMWGLKSDKMNMEGAWDITQGSSDVTVAVIDSGVDDEHEDFQGGNVQFVQGVNLWPGGCGRGPNDPGDDQGHGTHVAGTIGAATDNNEGISGINWNLKLLAIKVGCTGREFSTSGILNGLEYAADHGADVVNMSFGGWGDYDPGRGIDPCNTFNQILEYARDSGVVLAAAAGNEGGNISDDMCQDDYTGEVFRCKAAPAACDAVTLTVGATDQNDRRSIWTSAKSSNYDTSGGVDVAAPGTGIYSLQLGGGYVASSGTSMAAPHVSGLAALLLAQDPTLSPEAVKRKIVDYADSIDTDRPIGPRINAYRSLSAGGQATPTATPTPTPTPTAGPTATPTSRPTTTPSPGAVTRLGLTVKLQGIDSQKRDREMAMAVDSHQYSLVFRGNEGGRFKGTIENPGIGSGNYTLAVKEPHHLTKEFSATLFAGANDIVRVSTGDELRAGDIDSNDDVDENDKTALLNAYSPFSVVDPAVVFGDLNEDGYVNSLDYSLLLTNLEGAASPTPTPPGPTPTRTATPTPTPDMDEWTGKVTLNNPQEMPVYVFVAVCVAKGDGKDCRNDFDFYVYREPDEEDGSYRFGGTVGFYYKTFALATDCKREITADDDQNPYKVNFPYKPCRENLDDYYDTDGPVWVTPPDSGIDFVLDVECVYGEVEEGYMEDHPCDEFSDPFAVCEPGKGDYNCHAINTGDGWVWDWYKRVAHKPGTPGPCYPDVPECALYTYADSWGHGCCDPATNSWLPNSDCDGKECGSNGACDGEGACD